MRAHDPGAPDDSGNPPAAAAATEGPPPQMSTHRGGDTSLGAGTDTVRQRTSRPCELCQRQGSGTHLAALAVGVLLAVTAGRFTDARFLLTGLCPAHTDGAITTALTSARLLDAALRDLADQFPALNNLDGPELPHELTRRLALDLARHDEGNLR